MNKPAVAASIIAAAGGAVTAGWLTLEGDTLDNIDVHFYDKSNQTNPIRQSQ